ncbi:hypothetical protein ACJ41O_014759 [Fusarium nematophilum]
MTEPAPPSKKLKFKRRYSPKSRTGCITCKHVKCDEEKPICRRCRDARVKCDGYVTSEKQETTPDPRKLKTQSLVAFNPAIAETSIERCYFHHFHSWTSKQLSNSPDASNFWIQHVLPLAHTCEPIKHAVIAVGAAHRFYMAGQDTRSPLQQLRGLAMQQYNKAISNIVPRMSLDSTFSIHCTLVCCLLFVSFEGITGRYAESIRHLKAGNRLLGLPALASSEKDRAVTRKLTEMFSNLSVEASVFMEDTIVPRIQPEGTDDLSPTPFRDLDEAAYELRRLDVAFVDIMAQIPWPDPTAVQDSESTEWKSHCGLGGENPLFTELEEKFKRWNSRFEPTRQMAETRTPISRKLMNLILAQKFWELGMSCGDYGEPAPLEGVEAFLDAADTLAQSFAALNQPTFSLDGDLISGLSFVIAMCTDAKIRQRALNLLRSLNRREGVWDSREIVEVHEAALSLNDETWYQKEVPGGIPGLVAELARISTRVNSTNSILLTAGYIT